MASWGRSGGPQDTTARVRNGCVTTKGAYFIHDVLQRVRAVDGEAHEDDVCLGVREWTQPVVFLLAGRVPQGELDHLASRRVRRVRDVVLEDGGNVFLEAVSETQDDAWSRRASGKLPEL